MARYEIPPNLGKVRIAMGVGGTFAVWNGKVGKKNGEFRILCRTRKTAEYVMQRLNNKQHNGAIEVLG